VIDKYNIFNFDLLNNMTNRRTIIGNGFENLIDSRLSVEKVAYESSNTTFKVQNLSLGLEKVGKQMKNLITPLFWDTLNIRFFIKTDRAID